MDGRSLGRNHSGPDIADLIELRAGEAMELNQRYLNRQLGRVLAADSPSLPQLGTSTLAGVLGEQLIQRAPASLDAVVLTSSGTESVEAALKLARAATNRPRLLYCER